MLRAVSVLLLLSGCGSPQLVNPSLPVTAPEARAMLAGMRDAPVPLQRPVVVLGGIGDPGFVAPRVADAIGEVCSGQMIVAVSFFGAASETFDECRDHLLGKIEKSLGSGEPGWTVEVDVVAFSMGGLVARHAALPREDGGTRLKMRRLFTISTPHRGAEWAMLPTWDRRKLDMRPGSAFLARLDANLDGAGYEILPYVRLGDAIVGSENAAPPGRTAWWVSTPALSMAHVAAPHDPRIMADIALRLRGEPAVATEP